MATTSALPADPKTLRLWPAVLIAAAAVIAITFVEVTEDTNRQGAHMAAGAIGILAVLLLFVWALAFSRVSWRRRLWLAGVPALALGALAASVRIEGVDGDLLPRLAWRWEARAAPVAASAVAADANGVAAADAGRTPRPLPPAPEGAADFGQFFGPDRTGVIGGIALADDWQAQPPRELWRVPVGEGWSGFAVADGLAITQEQHGDDEAAVAYDLATGAVHWVHRRPGRYESTIAGNGPRATPTIDGDTVFVQGSTGQLSALELASGREIWSTNVLHDAGTEVPEWGFACSPLVVDEVVVTNPGGAGRSIAAYRRASGDIAWTGGDDPTSWSSPCSAELLGQKQILMFGADFVTGYGLDGVELWKHPWKAAHPHVAMPVPIGSDALFVSSGYGTGCQLVRLARSASGAIEPAMAWRSLSLKAKFANVLAEGDAVYGLDDGKLVCVDASTGKRRWRGPRYGHGQLLRVGGHLLVTAEEGDLVLCRADKDSFEEVARHPVFDHKVWNPPALAGSFLLMRTDREAVCLQLPTR